MEKETGGGWGAGSVDEGVGPRRAFPSSAKLLAMSAWGKRGEFGCWWPSCDVTEPSRWQTYE